MTAIEERALKAKRRAIKRQEKERKRAELDVRRLRRKRVRAGGPIICRNHEEPSYADLRSAKFSHLCPDCGRQFKDESVFEHSCEFCRPVSGSAKKRKRRPKQISAETGGAEAPRVTGQIELFNS